MKNNQLIVNCREAGKTTYLFELIKKIKKEGYDIIVLDSATEHADKSLLKKVMIEYQDSILIDNHDESVVASYEELNSINNMLYKFPYNEIINNIGKTICFDLSYFLEKGHKAFDTTGDVEAYEYYRGLYRRMAQQILSTLIALDINEILNNIIVFMDEIEFPIVEFDVTKLQKNLVIFAAVHQENSFGTFYKSCEHVNFIPYQKRKEMKHDFKRK